MQGNRTYAIVCLLAILMGPAMVSAEWDDMFGPPKEVALSEILQNPGLWLDVPVRVELRFARFSKIYNPFFTKFTEDVFMNFFAWDVQTQIWTKEGFNTQYPYFYVRKDNSELKTFLKLTTFDTVVVYGKVQGVFDEKPYFEIAWICRLEGNLNIYNLRLLNRAMQAFNAREFSKAEGIFTDILATEPPNDIQSMIYKTMAKIRMFEYRDFETAEDHLDESLSLMPKDAEAQSLYNLCEHYLDYGGVPPVYQDAWPDTKAVPEVKKPEGEIGTGAAKPGAGKTPTQPKKEEGKSKGNGKAEESEKGENPR